MKRRTSELADLIKATHYRDSMCNKADGRLNWAPVWYGWALVEAYLTGLKQGRKSDNGPCKKSTSKVKRNNPARGKRK